MPFTKSRNAYEFDLQGRDYQNAGGLPGLLREAMQRQVLQQGNQADSTARVAPDPHSDAYGNPQGLFGRLLALQTSQGSPIGIGQGGSTSDVTPNVIPVQYGIPIPGSGGLPLPPIVPQRVTENLMPPDPWPTIGSVLYSGLTRQRLRGHPGHQEENASTLAPSPQSVPQTPTPNFPEPWPTFGKVMQLLPGLALDLRKEDDEGCPNCREKEKASTDGTGEMSNISPSARISASSETAAPSTPEWWDTANRFPQTFEAKRPTSSECVDRCSHLLPSPSGDLQSSEFRLCYAQCRGRL